MRRCSDERVQKKEKKGARKGKSRKTAQCTDLITHIAVQISMQVWNLCRQRHMQGRKSRSSLLCGQISQGIGDAQQLPGSPIEEALDEVLRIFRDNATCRSFCENRDGGGKVSKFVQGQTPLPPIPTTRDCNLLRTNSDGKETGGVVEGQTGDQQNTRQRVRTRQGRGVVRTTGTTN